MTDRALSLVPQPNQQGTASQTQIGQLYASTVAAAIVAAGGKVELAAERLSKQLGWNITKELMVGVLAEDQQASDSLVSQLRTLSIFQTFDLLRGLANTITERIASDEMESKDIVKAYSSVSQLLNSLTDNKVSTQNVNITEVVMRMLPPSVREAVGNLIEVGRPSETDEGVA